MSGPKYTTGQRVEVLAFDFETPGFPEVWMPSTVTLVEPRDCGRWDVGVRRDNGQHAREIVGQRGGNKRIRPL